MENILNFLIAMISSALAPSNRTLVPFDNLTLTHSLSLSLSLSRSHSHGLKLVKNVSLSSYFLSFPGVKCDKEGERARRVDIRWRKVICVLL